MRIVQLANFHGPNSGGLRVAVDALRAGYQAAGHDVTLIVPGPRDAHRGDVRMLRAPLLPNGSGYRVLARRRPVLDTLDALAPDLVEAHDPLLQQWVWSWTRAAGVPLVAVAHERLSRTLPMLLPVLPHRLACSAGAAVTQRAATRCDALVVCSRATAAEYTRASVVPLGVDLDTFRPEATRPGRVELVVAGRLSAEKRPDLAIAAAALIPGAHLTVLGSGPWEHRLRHQAAGQDVTFRGFVTDRCVLAAHLARADLAFVPGPAETFGLAALEALACGTPVVTVSGAATSELVAGRPQAGRAVSADPAAFAQAAARLLAVGRDVRRSAARAVAVQYPWSATVQRLLAVHASVTAPAAA